MIGRGIPNGSVEWCSRLTATPQSGGGGQSQLTGKAKRGQECGAHILFVPRNPEWMNEVQVRLGSGTTVSMKLLVGTSLVYLFRRSVKARQLVTRDSRFVIRGS